MGGKVAHCEARLVNRLAAPGAVGKDFTQHLLLLDAGLSVKVALNKLLQLGLVRYVLILVHDYLSMFLAW